MNSAFESSWNSQSPQAAQRREAMLQRIAQLRALEERAAQASARSQPVFDKRGQLLPRARVGLLLDAGAPWLPLCSLAGFMQDAKDPAQSVPGGGIIAGIGFVSGVRCMVVASDSGIEAGAMVSPSIVRQGMKRSLSALIVPRRAFIPSEMTRTAL